MIFFYLLNYIYIYWCLFRFKSNKEQAGEQALSHGLSGNRLGIIRPFLTEKATTQLVCCRIFNGLDYCKSFLAGTISEQMSRIHRVQNSAAKEKRGDQATSLKYKHTNKKQKQELWLPLKQKIYLKIVTLVYNYFSNTLHLTCQPSLLRSSLCFSLFSMIFSMILPG